MKILVIVESPSKCKKIEGYLNSAFPNHKFKCMASVGHIMNLSKRNGVEINNGFKPNFIPITDKKKVIQGLKQNARYYEKILVATDPDREGEKIAYDIYDILGLNVHDKIRMVFNEITKKGVTNGFNNLKRIDLDLVFAQIARRVLDRLLGFGLSGITMKEVQRGASVGRVLSPTTKIIYDREKEIENSESNSEYPVYGDFTNKKYDLEDCTLDKLFLTKDEVLNFMKRVKKSTFSIEDIKIMDKKSNPSLPFITSTVNQASPYSVKKTTKILQTLYQKGHITYIRTDSTLLSDDAVKMIAGHITDTFGKANLQVRNKKKKVKNAQEAHECIRPTKMVETITGLDNDHRKLYELIYKRTVASQMKPYEFKHYEIIIKSTKSKYKFMADIDIPIKYGWKMVYKELLQKMKVEKKQDLKLLKVVNKGDKLEYTKIFSKERIKYKYPRYTESRLVKKLEELGIGRPSTYMTAVTNIQTKQYVKKGMNQGESKMVDLLEMTPTEITENQVEIFTNSDYGKMILTELGEKITDYLGDNFDMLIDYNLTARMEEDLDKVASGNIKWDEVVKKYYSIVSGDIDKKKKSFKRQKGGDDGKSYMEKNRNKIGEYKGKDIYSFFSRWGPRITIGEPGAKETKYITPENGIVVNELTIEQAIEQIEKNQPKKVGKYKGKDIIILKGRYGFYIKYGTENVGIHYTYKRKNPLELTLEECVDCIKRYAIKKTDKKSVSKKPRKNKKNENKKK